METFDVVVVGGGPGGSSTATFLADGGLRVALFERERFPRFHVGESLMPATMLLLEELGAKAAIEERGFQVKYGASFIDEENDDATQTFYFLPGQPWPNYSYQVPRADFDAVLLDHAKKRGVTVCDPDGLLDAMIARCRGVSENLAGAARVTPVYRVANFSYDNSPVVGDRFVAVGDAIAFVDPIFSGGVYIALRSGQLASVAIRDAFRAGDFSARRFADYERRVRAGLDPLFKFIHKYYEPSFFDLLMRPRNHFGIYEAVLNVLSGGNWVTMPWRVRAALRILYGIARINAWVRRRAGLPVESRLEW